MPGHNRRGRPDSHIPGRVRVSPVKAQGMVLASVPAVRKGPAGLEFSYPRFSDRVLATGREGFHHRGPPIHGLTENACAASGRTFVSDPSAGSPTETLLRLLLPLNDTVWTSFRSTDATRKPHRSQSEVLTKSFNR